MTTASASTKLPTSAARPAPGADPIQALARPGAWVPLALLAAAFVSLSWRWLLKQYQPHIPAFDWKFLEPLGGYSWQKPQDWGHAYMVPLISIYALYKDRAKITERPRSAFWPGVVVAVLGTVMYIFFIVGFSNHMFQGGSLVLALSGLSLMVFGPRVFGVLVFPLAYLLLAVTVSESVMNNMTYRLQDIAAQGAWATLNMIGIETDIAGNVLTLHDSLGNPLAPLNVATACSGMRMVIAFIALGAAVGWLGCAFWWQRIALFLMGVPTAVFMNIIRVAFLGVMSLWDPNFATGEAHAFIGNVLLVPSFFLFIGIMWALKRIVPEPEPVKVGAKAKPARKPAQGAKA